MMMRTTYETAWRLLDLLGHDRPPVLQAAIDEFRRAMELEDWVVSQIPENPYFQEQANEVRD